MTDWNDSPCAAVAFCEGLEWHWVFERTRTWLEPRTWDSCTAKSGSKLNFSLWNASEHFLGTPLWAVRRAHSRAKIGGHGYHQKRDGDSRSCSDEVPAQSTPALDRDRAGRGRVMPRLLLHEDVQPRILRGPPVELRGLGMTSGHGLGVKGHQAWALQGSGPHLPRFAGIGTLFVFFQF